MSRLDLPMDDALDEIEAALAGRGTLVLLAEPGAGKTTRLPPRLAADASRRERGKIIVLEPRRLAARAAAQRMAEEDGTALGQRFGFRVRDEGKESATTEVLVVTEGLFLRWIARDPELDGVACVVFDEFHERNLDADLSLALTVEVRASLRHDLEIVVMSATLDPGPVADFLGGAPVVDVPGRTHAVDLHYAPRRGHEERLEDAVASACGRALDEGARGVLAFLPGMAEIRRTAERLERRGLRSGATLLPLHGELPWSDQRRALSPSSSPRVVLATNVAESSLTVPDIDCVVDSGLVRRARRDPEMGFSRLSLERVSRASADQRAGRAGRQGPGRCLRLWSALEHKALDEFEQAELHRVDLAESRLLLLDQGVADAAEFGWFETPSSEAIASADKLLVDLGLARAAAAGSRITETGRRVARLPLHPRLGALVVAGRAAGIAYLTCATAALLSERDLPEARKKNRSSRSDVLDRLDLLESGRGGSPHAVRVRRTTDRLARLVGARKPKDAGDEEALMRALFAAFPDRLARRRVKGKPEATMAGGRGVILAEESAVKDDELFLALVITGSRRGVRARDLVRIASAVDRPWLDAVFPGVTAAREVVSFDAETGRVVVVLETVFLSLVLDRRNTGGGDPERVAGVLAAAITERSSEFFGADAKLVRFRRRLEWLRRAETDDSVPRLTDEDIAKMLEPVLIGHRSLAAVRTLPILGIVRGSLAPGLLRRLARELPESVTLPGGREVRIQYPPDGEPEIRARVQHLFGVWETPRLAGGTVALVVELLAPNSRPVQRTTDLESFWTRTYSQVRKDLRGRYPKHDWPEQAPSRL